MPKININILCFTALILVVLGCKKEPNDNLSITLSRNKVNQNYIEGHFNLDSNKYFISIRDRNGNNKFQDKNEDIIMIRNETNKLFVADILENASVMLINGKLYSFQQLNDSIVNLTASPNPKSDSIHLFELNDTMLNLTLHHFNNDSTTFLYDVVDQVFCDSILIYIWETHCPPCRKDLDKFVDMESENLKIIHLCLSDNAVEANELMSRKSYKPFFTGYIDVLDKSKVYCIGFPTKFYINKDKYITKYFF
ncbi:MAG: hypothetical protein IPI50_10130 [Saprospiraceae bacterium]|nr:hypothetical protein [Saprospiraceae bacterium]